MGKVFMYGRKIYSISDRNALNEFVVVKLSFDKKNVEGVKVIPAKTEKQVEQLIRHNQYDRFKTLPMS